MAEESATIEVQEIIEAVTLNIEETVENVLIEIQEIRGPAGADGAPGPVGPQGPPGDGTTFREILAGVVDGVNVAFTCLDNILEDSETVFINGLAQFPGLHYTVVGNTITLDDPAETGDHLLITYVRG